MLHFMFGGAFYVFGCMHTCLPATHDQWGKLRIAAVQHGSDEMSAQTVQTAALHEIAFFLC